jgi:tetratricopeptide (TPR) repeat protein
MPFGRPLAPALGLLLLAVAGLAAMGLITVQLWPEARANALAMQPLAQVRAWQAPRAQPPDPEAWLRTRAALDRALAITPQAADLHEAMAYLYLSVALRPDPDPLVQGPYLKQALAHLQQATAARPMVPSAWANQALAFHQLALLEVAEAEPHRSAMWRAFDRALAHGQRERGVQQALGVVAFAHWANLSPVRRQAVTTMHAQATPSQQRALLALASAHEVDLGS